MKRQKIIAGGLLVSLFLSFIVWMLVREVPSDPKREMDSPTEVLDVPDQGALADVSNMSSPMRNTENARLLQFDGVTGAMEVRVGGPGLDAAFEASIVGGLMPMPLRYEGEEVPTIEVRAKSEEGCFWGDIPANQDRVSMTQGGRLRIALSDDLGRPIPGAKVRLGRDFVSFLFDHGESNAVGVVDMDCVPAGEYAVSIKAPGFVAEHVRVSGPGDVDVMLTKGYRLEGQVLNQEGEAVQDASLLISSCEEDSCVPESLQESSTNGKFNADNLRAAHVSVQVRHPNYETREVREMAGGPVQIRLTKAQPRSFFVVDSEERPVPGALVEWESDVDRGRGNSGQDGVWEDRGAPTGARARASLGNFTSPWVEVQGHEVRLNVESQAMHAILLRVEAPEAIALVEVTRVDDSANCPATRINASDFRLDCREGAASLAVTMERGVYRTKLDLQNGSTVTVPGAKDHKLIVTSREVPGAEINFGTGWQPLVLSPSSEQTWESAFDLWGESSDVKVRLRAARMGETIVNLSGSETQVELKPMKSYRLWVLDAQGSPVTGAWMGLVDSDGVRLPWARSSGQLPFERRIREGESVSVFVVDPRRGAGLVSLGAKQEELRIELRSPVFEATQAPYIGLESAQSLIGAPFVRDGQSYRIDEMNAEAQKSGMVRGAWWVAGWRESSGTRVILWTGKSYSEHLIKVK